MTLKKQKASGSKYRKSPDTVPDPIKTDVLIVGAGAAGLMCAGIAAARGRSVIVAEHTDRIAEKIRISGGGRCNFTNLESAPDKYLSSNPHFCVSALKRFSAQDFIKMVEGRGIPYHEKTLGQLFCDHSATDIIDMLVDLCTSSNANIRTKTTIHELSQNADGTFTARTTIGNITAQSVVIATGGLSVPKIGATPFGYEIAKQFGINIIPPRAGLVPLTFDQDTLSVTKDLSGISIDPVCVSSVSKKTFTESMLFTHRGISGPAILQISSYWNPGEDIFINMSPDTDMFTWLKDQKQHHPKSMITTILSHKLPKRLVQSMISEFDPVPDRLADFPDSLLHQIADRINKWTIRPSGSEGYRTAEVTLGGVDTQHISSKTFEAKDVKGLYFIGEVLDVTGHLGGYNFQWAWSSGWCAGQFV